MISWIKQMFHQHIGQDVPAELARCEFGCRVGQCSRGECEECEKRVQFAKLLDEQGLRTLTEAALMDIKSSAAMSMAQQAWPLATLMLAVLFNLLWIGLLGYAVVRLL
jgi:hypothetical protein